MTTSKPASPPIGRGAAPAAGGGAMSAEMSLGSARAIVTTLDQGLSSVSNFAVGVVVARVAGVKGLGGFALAYSAWLLIAAVHRGLITDPMAITGDGRRSRTSSRELQAGLAAEITLGVISAAALVAFGIALVLAGQDAFGVPELVLAPWIPALLAQDYWRWIGFMHANPKASLANDLVFDLVQAITFAALLVSRAHSSQLVIAAWGFSGLVAALFGLWQFRVRPRFRGGLASLSRKFAVGGWIGAGAVAGWGVAQMYSVITAITLGPVGLGGLRAAQNLVAGPSFVLIQAGGSVGLPEASKAYDESGWTGLKRVSRIVTGAGVLSVGLVLVATVLFGRTLIRLLYGPSFGRFQPVAIVFALSFTIAVVSLGDILELKATKRTRPLFTVQVVAMISSIVGVAALSLAFGVVGAAVGFGVGTTVLTAGQILAGRRLQDDRPDADADEPGAGALRENEQCKESAPGEAADIRDMPFVLITTPLLGAGPNDIETHIREVEARLQAAGGRTEVVTPLQSMGRRASALVAPRGVLARIFPSATARCGLHLRYLRLRASLWLRLGRLESAVVYAQCPLSAAAAVKAARGGSHKVVLGVRLSGVGADEWVYPNHGPSGAMSHRLARRAEQSMVDVDALVYLSDCPSGRGPADGAALLTIGTLEVGGRHAYLLNVLAEAAAMGRRFTLDVVGTGTQRRELMRRAEALGVGHQVRFVGYRRDPLSLLSGYDAYVRASYDETGTLALVGAMSSGLPVFAPPAGAVGDILADGRCGLAWPVDDAHTAAAQLIGVLEDPDRLAAMADAARRRFPGVFTNSHSAQALTGFFRSLAAPGGITTVWGGGEPDTLEGIMRHALTAATPDCRAD